MTDVAVEAARYEACQDTTVGSSPTHVLSASKRTSI